ncbi:hypothetical protein GXW74_08265 [Roseomonas eburnea]|uniref:Uncharacterized protein n=1 Tax=Neoroseomonas eburnea TaxID=1346889 RepID=A0A9X9X9U2_9PROT|nr:hypothetical protein [Neoroseomonas eburnea]MBR0680478.1 hypothetical protein [Neoroseomonas eburnea]
MPEGIGGWIAFLIEKSAMPLALAGAGWLISNAVERDKLVLEQEKVNQVMLGRAMTVLFEGREQERVFGRVPQREEIRTFRAHWIATYNAYARVQLDPVAIGIFMEVGLDDDAQRITPGTRLPPIAATIAPTSGPATGPRGDGWVSVGRPNTTRYADLNFDLLQGAGFTRDGGIPVGTRMSARWSVNLRANAEVTTGSENPVRGLISVGQCVRVLESRPNLRGATWAFVSLDGCDLPG